MRLSDVSVALLALLLPTTSAAAMSSRAPVPTLGCRESLRVIRPATSSDSSYEDRHPLLREPSDPNRVPGPGSLVAVVRTDSLHHPHVYIEDATTKSSRLLLAKGAAEPRWSPDGRRIACIAWESPTEPWVLTIVDRDGRHLVQPLRRFNVMGFKWSPDGRWIAVTATVGSSGRTYLALVSALDGRVHVPDTVRVVTDYEFSWSPDSRVLAFARVTALNAYEEPRAADLWLVTPGQRPCSLVVSNDFVETQPRWVTSHRLRYTRVPRAASESVPEEVVLDLRPAARQ
jgi:dipeptidyl aminopeptidase/acylaminoacyl peptidase